MVNHQKTLGDESLRKLNAQHIEQFQKLQNENMAHV